MGTDVSWGWRREVVWEGNYDLPLNPIWSPRTSVKGRVVVSEVLKEASGEGSLQIGKMDLEGDLRIEE